jgi:hypothetical protein
MTMANIMRWSSRVSTTAQEAGAMYGPIVLCRLSRPIGGDGVTNANNEAASVGGLFHSGTFPCHWPLLNLRVALFDSALDAGQCHHYVLNVVPDAGLTNPHTTFYSGGSVFRAK